MSSKEMRKLIESIETAQVSEAMPGNGSFVATFIDHYAGEGGDDLIRKAVKMGGGDPEKSASALYNLTTKNGYGDTDLSDGLKAHMVMDKFVAEYPDAKKIVRRAWEKTGGDVNQMSDAIYDLTTKNGYGDTDLASAFNAMAGIRD